MAKNDDMSEGIACCLISGFILMSVGIGHEYGSGFGWFAFGSGVFFTGLVAMYLERKKNAK